MTCGDFSKPLIAVCVMFMYKIEEILKRVSDDFLPDEDSLLSLLKADSKEDIGLIFDFADKVRSRHVGDGIFLRGIIEFSNFCDNPCAYCGLNKENLRLKRYRMTEEMILSSVAEIFSNGLRTVVLQSGEERKIDVKWLAEIIREIKKHHDMCVTLSVGEHSFKAYKEWKDAGADRYLLKIETSLKPLYDSLHPGMSFENRIRCLCDLRFLGYETGCGNIVGLKGQTLRDLAKDIIFFKQNDFDMLGIGPFIPHPDTSLALRLSPALELVLKVIALTRIVTKDTNIPATTALGSMGDDFRSQGLCAGANVLMPNFTRQEFKKLYEIYPNKRCVSEASGACVGCMQLMAGNIKRHIDFGKGGRKYAHYA